MAYKDDIPTRSLYIHWPFCVYKCHFCPFIALASHDQFMARYHNVLCKEIEQFSGRLAKKQKIDTIFIGGGTPSTYPDALILDMFDTLRNMFIMKKSTEVTIEVNPGTVRKGQLDLWQTLGVNRLSIGVQSLNDFALKNLNRLQKANDVFALLGQAKEVFDNISVDLILGLPGVSKDEWKDLISKVVSWPITHISVYFLMVHENTPLYFSVKSKKVTLVGEESLIYLYHWTTDFLAQHGFEQYEISNFARSGYSCKHNIVYWDRKAYKGFGLGACSFDGSSRFQNQKNLIKYIEGIEKCENVEIFSETLTKEQIRLEKLMLGLRRSRGVVKADLFEELSIDQKRELENKIDYLKKNNFIYEKNGRLMLSPSALTIENEVVATLSV